MIRKNGSMSNVLRFKILDSSVTTGAGKTGLTNSSSGLVVSTIADKEPSATTYTAGGSTIESITTLGTFAAPTATKCRFKEVDATNHPGLYELQLADARFAVGGAKALRICVSGPTDAAQTEIEIQLSDVDLDNAAGLLDPILVEQGITPSANLIDDGDNQLSQLNIRQAASLWSAALAGLLGGADTSTTEIDKIGDVDHPRITATTDVSGRTAVVLKVPV